MRFIRFFLALFLVFNFILLNGCSSQNKDSFAHLNLSSKSVSVLIVPHHLIARDYIENGFRQVKALNDTAGKPIRRIVLIGPNHFFRGKNTVITISHDWNSDNGILESDKDFIRSMTTKNYASQEEDILEQDHSITALLPFIEKYFSDVSFVPLMVREPIRHDEAKKLGDFFAQEFGPETLIITSIDFSHYLSKEIADQHDKESIEALKKLDFDFFAYKIDADSPQILMVISEYLRKKGSYEFVMLSHTNSAELGGNLKEPSTTSHIIGYYLTFSL